MAETLRGAGRQGTSVHVVTEVVLGSGIVLWQQTVETKCNETPLVQRMLTERVLRGSVDHGGCYAYPVVNRAVGFRARKACAPRRQEESTDAVSGTAGMFC